MRCTGAALPLPDMSGGLLGAHETLAILSGYYIPIRLSVAGDGEGQAWGSRDTGL